MKDRADYRPRGTGSVYQVPGSRFWYMKYYRNGRAVVESTKQLTEEKAGKVLRRTLSALDSGNWLSPSDRKITVDELWEKLIQSYQMNRRDTRKLVQMWGKKGEDGRMEYGRVGAFFHDLRASQVTTDMLNDYVTQQQEAGLENATINRHLSALKRAFNLAYNSTPRKIQQVPVFPERLEEAPPRQGFVNQGEFDKLAVHAPGLWMRALLATAYAFGFRRGELLGMKVRQIDLFDRTIRLNRGETKSGEPRLVKMTEDVYQLLKASVEGKGPDDLVFTRSGHSIGDFRKLWSRMCKAAGLDGLLFHDLRRSAIRNMVRRGIPERVAMEISGHKTRSVFERYNIVSGADLTEATRKIEAGRKQEQAPVPEFGHSLVKVEPVTAADLAVN